MSDLHRQSTVREAWVRFPAGRCCICFDICKWLDHGFFYNKEDTDHTTSGSPPYSLRYMRVGIFKFPDRGSGDWAECLPLHPKRREGPAICRFQGKGSLPVFNSLGGSGSRFLNCSVPVELIHFQMILGRGSTSSLIKSADNKSSDQ